MIYPTGRVREAYDVELAAFCKNCRSLIASWREGDWVPLTVREGMRGCPKCDWKPERAE